MTITLLFQHLAGKATVNLWPVSAIKPDLVGLYLREL